MPARGVLFSYLLAIEPYKPQLKYWTKKIKYPILVQGDKPKAILLDDFKEKGNMVLLGTASFWEGIDVRGEALSTVIIDKLPFSSPPWRSGVKNTSGSHGEIRSKAIC